MQSMTALLDCRCDIGRARTTGQLFAGFEHQPAESGADMARVNNPDAEAGARLRVQRQLRVVVEKTESSLRCMAMQRRLTTVGRDEQNVLVAWHQSLDDTLVNGARTGNLPLRIAGVVLQMDAVNVITDVSVTFVEDPLSSDTQCVRQQLFCQTA